MAKSRGILILLASNLDIFTINVYYKHMPRLDTYTSEPFGRDKWIAEHIPGFLRPRHKRRERARRYVRQQLEWYDAVVFAPEDRLNRKQLYQVGLKLPKNAY